MALLLGLILLVALMIPIVGILVDSPIGRAIGRRLEGPEPVAGLADLARKVEVLEGELEELTRAVEVLREESQFMHRLLEEGGSRSSLPPPASP